MISSAIGVIAGRPSRVAVSPSLTSPAPARLGSSGCCNTKQIKAARIGEHAAHDERIGHRLDPVGKADRTIRCEQPHFGQLAPLQPLGSRRIGMDLGELGLAGTAGEELDHRDIVDRRVGVRQRHHRRDAAGRGGPPAALDRFEVLGPRLAQLHAHVDEPRRQAQPVGQNRLGVSCRVRQIAADRGDPLALDQQITRRVEPACRVEQPGVADQQAVHGSAGRISVRLKSSPLNNSVWSVAAASA